MTRTRCSDSWCHLSSDLGLRRFKITVLFALDPRLPGSARSQRVFHPAAIMQPAARQAARHVCPALQGEGMRNRRKLVDLREKAKWVKMYSKVINSGAAEAFVTRLPESHPAELLASAHLGRNYISSEDQCPRAKTAEETVENKQKPWRQHLFLCVNVRLEADTTALCVYGVWLKKSWKKRLSNVFLLLHLLFVSFDNRHSDCVSEP